MPCHKRTVGLLSRRPVMVAEKRYIGKEANELEGVEAGLVDELEEVLTSYDRDTWDEVQRVLRTLPVERIMAETGYSRRHVFYLRAGKRRPTGDRGTHLLALCALTSVAEQSPEANWGSFPPIAGVSAPTPH